MMADFHGCDNPTCPASCYALTSDVRPAYRHDAELGPVRAIARCGHPAAVGYVERHRPEPDYGGAYDGVSAVYSDADPGL